MTASLMGKLGTDGEYGYKETENDGVIKRLVRFRGHDYLELNQQQGEAVRQIRRLIDRSRRSGCKTVVVLTGGQGSGKTLVALALLSYQLRNERAREGQKSVQLLMQGQTMKQWATKLPMPYRKHLSSWGGRTWADGENYELVIADEVHLMLPHGLGNQMSGLNNASAESRLASLQSLLGRATACRDDPAFLSRITKKQALTVPTIQGVERGVGQVLLLIRDETQVVDRRAMSSTEFETCLNWLKEQGYFRADTIHLEATHRTSLAWTQFVTTVFSADFECPLAVENELGDKYRRHFKFAGANGAYFKDETAPSGKPFIAMLASAAQYVERLLGAPGTTAGPTRVLATHGWPWTKSEPPAKDITFPGENWNRSWNLGRLSDWSVRESSDAPYTSAKNGVGYVKLVQGMEFARVAVLIGPELSWQQELQQRSCPLNQHPHHHGAWRVDRKNAHLCRRGATAEEVLTLSLSQSRVLLLRARERVVIYAHEQSVRDLMQTWLKPRSQEP